MSRGPIYDKWYKPQFSGHETFPLRHGWLKKAYDAVRFFENQSNPFSHDDAIARFGVGKNMVNSMRHWATASGIIEKGDAPNTLKTALLGDFLFGEDGHDHYMENPTSLWLIHWNLCGNDKKTTWYWAFNNFSHIIFERERLVKALEKVAIDCDWPRVASITIKRDVECFLNTYATKKIAANSNPEDTLESPLTELALIKSIGKRDGFRFVRGAKSTLSNGVFLYALIQFWKYFSESTQTLSFEAIAHEAGSPGRVFLLDENNVADYLLSLEQETKGAFRWSETAGLKQIIKKSEVSLDSDLSLGFVAKDYLERRGEAA